MSDDEKDALLYCHYFAFGDEIFCLRDIVIAAFRHARKGYVKKAKAIESFISSLEKVGLYDKDIFAIYLEELGLTDKGEGVKHKVNTIAVMLLGDEEYLDNKIEREIKTAPTPKD